MRLSPTPRWSSREVELFLLTPDDVGARYVQWLNNPEVNRFLESRFAQHDVSSTRAFVARLLDSDRDLFLGILSVSLDRHVGNIKLGPIDFNHRVGEIGIMIGDENAHGQGIGTRAISMMADIAANEVGLRKVTAGCYSGNIGSRRAFTKSGFTEEGVRRGQFLLDGATEDLVLFGKLLA